ncbi:hypothetical protein JDV09_16940 [Mycobacterium sp. Y57]|uniref:hypothetical protein n=1 Tax=Mycolicibacterium xanthum TaxID=2796469 RepID=UPI001C85177D|nr:hypothetical protein [Mycolicibacterium xanthum]MBX7433782.1 hypothetical protein [Mycolicibacterium xanthum]
MTITIDVRTRLDDQALQRASRQLHDEFDKNSRLTGQQMSDNLTAGLSKFETRAVDAAGKVSVAETKLNEVRQRAQRDADDLAKAERHLADLRSSGITDLHLITRAENDLTRIRDRQSRTITQLSAATENHNRLRRAESLAIRDAASAYKDLQITVTEAETASSRFGQLATGLPGALGPLAPIAIAGVVGGLVELAGVAASAAQSLWLLPAAAGAAAVGFGTLKIGMQGFSQALGDMRDPEKFAKDLQSLSPAAQQTALSIRNLLPAFDGLKSAVQDSLFSGMGSEIQKVASVYLPELQRTMASVAGTVSRLLQGVGNELLNPQTRAAITDLLHDVAAAFKAIEPAAAPLTRAMASIAQVGSSFLPQLATAAADAAQHFSDFIQQAQQSGQLKKWLSDGLQTLKQLGSDAWALSKALMSLAPVGQKVLPDISRILHDVADLMPVIEKTAELVGPQFGVWEVGLKQVSTAVHVLHTGFDDIKTVVYGVGSVVLDVAQKIRNALNDALAPVRAAAKLIGVDISLPNVPTMPDIISSPSSPSGPTFEPPGRTPGTYRRRDGSTAAVPTPGIPLPSVPSSSSSGGSSSGYKAPSGSKSDPVYTAPATTTPSSMPSGGNDIYNPLAEAASGGFTLPNIARMATTFLAELAMGNPLGRLQATQPVSVVNWPQQMTGEGGQLPAGVQNAIALAQSANGSPYSYGAADLTKGLADCSGAISSLYGALTGQDPTTRHFTTTSNFPSLGFQPGYSPSSFFNIGVNPKPGKSGHMVGSLGGIPVEDGGAGSGFRFGGSAAGPMSLPQQWHLPNSMIAGYGGGGVGPVGYGGIPQGSPMGITGASPRNKAEGTNKSQQLGTTNKSPGFGISGGLIGSAEGAAAAGVNMMAPGAGAGVDIATQEANRFAGYLGQLGGIAAEGLLETFSLNDSPLADPSKSLPGKIIFGLAGAHPSAPNSAGKTQPPLKPDDKQQQGQQGNQTNAGMIVHGDVNVGQGQDSKSAMADLQKQQNRNMMQYWGGSPT